MDSLLSPRFKSKVEKFYFENLTASNEDLFVNGHDKDCNESLKVTEARKRAYSGDGRKSYFTFDTDEIIKRQRNKRMTFILHSIFALILNICILFYFTKATIHCTWKAS